MRSLLLVADQPEWLTQLHERLGEVYTLFSAESQVEALEVLQLTKVDVVVGAFEARSWQIVQFFERAKVLQPHCVTLYLAPPPPPEGAAAESCVPQSDFCLRRPFTRDELRRTIEQALDKQRLIEALASQREPSAVQQPSVPPAPGGELSLVRVGQILRDFAKAFSMNFDLSRALNLFLDAIGEFLRPSRLSILVRNPATQMFEIHAYRGLPPKVAESLALRADEGLPLWLATEARILHRAEAESHLRNPAYLDVYREMQALRSTLSMPLLASGRLVGILNLGERVTGLPYTGDELEMLFSLASQVAIGIQDIHLYRELQYQKRLFENILTDMSSGVITIGTDECVRVFNHRAAEILGKSAAAVLHEDLRSLPSPLGDLLYETLRHGVTYRRHEVLLAAGKRPLEVSTYQIFDEQRQVSGSVMVVEDLTAQKQLYEERRRADRLDFLNKVVGRMAHEIKNPLVSIKIFVELLDEQYNDMEFRQHFSTVMKRDVQALDSIAEKLLYFAGKIPYRFERGDIRTTITQCISSLTSDSQYSQIDYLDEEKQFIPSRSNIEVIYESNIPLVKFDQEQFGKSFSYLLFFLAHNLKGTGKIALSVKTLQEEDKSICITISGMGCSLSSDDLQNLFDPFSAEQSTLIDVGPCIAQKIIEEHGGRLDVRQETENSVTFTIALPLAE